jgi:hypothetical protein
MNYRVWYSTESFAKYILENTILGKKTPEPELKKIAESDTNNPTTFHQMPDHIKKILYLDAPDLIVEKITAQGFEPIFSIEESKEAGTGHNAFQRFARLSASVENNVPALYIYPEATIIRRKKKGGGYFKRWDKINPLILKAMDRVMTIYDIPALLFYFPSYYRSHSDPNTAPNQRQKGRKHDTILSSSSCPDRNDPEIKSMFMVIDEIISEVERLGVIEGRKALLKNHKIRAIREWMNEEYKNKGGSFDASPLTSTIEVDTLELINFLEKFSGKDRIGELITSRKQTIIYKIDAGFRGDPYPGALAAIDYLKCRKNKTFEDREKNLVLCFGDLTIDDKRKTIKVVNNKKTKKSTINDFFKNVKSSEKKNLLTKGYAKLKKSDIPRYYMQVRYGSMYSKVKHVRVFSYFADAILFPDGVLWRDA